MSSSCSSFDACAESIQMDSKVTDPRDLKIQEQNELIRKLTEEMEKLRSKESAEVRFKTFILIVVVMN